MEKMGESKQSCSFFSHSNYDASEIVLYSLFLIKFTWNTSIQSVYINVVHMIHHTWHCKVRYIKRYKILTNSIDLVNF